MEGIWGSKTAKCCIGTSRRTAPVPIGIFPRVTDLFPVLNIRDEVDKAREKHGICLPSGNSVPQQRNPRESEVRPCAEVLYNPSNLHFAARVPNRIELHVISSLR